MFKRLINKNIKYDEKLPLHKGALYVSDGVYIYTYTYIIKWYVKIYFEDVLK